MTTTERTPLDITILAADLRPGLDQDEVRRAQLSPPRLAWGTVNGIFDHLRILGATITIERQMFRSDAACEYWRDALAARAPLISEAPSAEWNGRAHSRSAARVTYGTLN